MSLHYHIRWLPGQKLDWERFETAEAAHQRARELVRPGERYTIESFDADCRACIVLDKRTSLAELLKSKAACR